MEITVDRTKMIKEIETDKEDYKKEYETLKQLYRKKIEEYLAHVVQIVNDGKDEAIKQAPYPPTYRIKEFDESIQLLNAHVNNTLKMDDHEYRQMKEGIEQIKMSNRTSINALSALSY